MKQLSLIALITLFFSVSSWSCTTQKKTSLASQQMQSESIKKPEPTEVKEGVRIYRDLRYGDKPQGIGEDISSDRTLDLYEPLDNMNKKLPVFLFIHGGGFGGGDKADKGNEALCLKMASHGFAVISINYYLTLKHEKTAGASCTANMSKGLSVKGFHPKLHEAIENASNDAQLALEWIKNEGGQFKLDQSRVAVSGGSAGAMTALHAAYASNQKVLPIRAVVNLWGGLENSEHIKKDAPPLLTYHGDQDKLINVDYAYDLEKQMKKNGVNQSKTYIIKGKGHAIYNLIREERTGEIASFLNEVF